MEFFQRYSTVLSGLAIVAILYGGYVLFFAPPSEPALSVTAVIDSSDQELIALLLSLKSIRLDETLFSDRLFSALKDFGQELITEPVGRTNPFAPLSGEGRRTP